MISIEVENCKPDMVILEEDSYGNNIYVVVSEPYQDENMLVIDVEDVLTKEVISIGGDPNHGYGPCLFRLL